MWCLKHGPWQITKALVATEARYTLTHDARLTQWCGTATHAVLGVFRTVEEAMEAAK